MLARACRLGRCAAAALAAAAAGSSGQSHVELQVWACTAAAGERWQCSGRADVDSSAALGSGPSEHGSGLPAAAQPAEGEPSADPLLGSDPAQIAAELRRVEARLAKLYADSAALQEREGALVAAEERLQRQAGFWGGPVWWQVCLQCAAGRKASSAE